MCIRDRYLRESSEIPTSVKIGLQGKVLFSGKQARFFKVRDQLSTARFQIERLGQLLVDETEVTVEVEICAVDVGKKLKAKSKPRTRKRASRRPPPPSSTSLKAPSTA